MYTLPPDAWLFVSLAYGATALLLGGLTAAVLHQHRKAKRAFVALRQETSGAA